MSTDRERELEERVRELEGRVRELEGRVRELEGALSSRPADGSNDLFTLFMRHLPGLAHMKDENHRILYVNESFESTFRVALADWIGKTVFDLFPEETAKQLHANDARVLAGETLEIEEVVEQPGGRLHYLTYKFPIRVAGRPTILGGVSIDITTLKQYETELERRAREERALERERLEAMQVLAGGVAHDFNNLLVIVLLHAGLLRQALPADAPEQSGLEAIEAAGQRAALLAEELLAFSKGRRFETEPLDLSEVVRAAASILRSTVPPSITVELELAADLPAVDVAKSQLDRVLLNLVLNAGEAIGSRRGTIRVRTDATFCGPDVVARSPLGLELEPGEYVRLVISDDGPGMPPEVKRRIFDPFFTTKTRGKGLGLATVLGIVRSHGGFVDVDSTSGAGTTFTLYFPVRRRADGATRPHAAPRGRPRGGTVLVVDDDANVRTAARAALESDAFEVLEADDGLTGLRLLGEHRDRVRAVVLDWHMPQGDGASTLARIRAEFGSLPVLVHSGAPSSAVLDTVAHDPWTAFLAKPYGDAELRDAVAGLLLP